MKILIVDQCSGAKKDADRYDPIDQDTLDAVSRAELLERDGVASYPAGELYEGRQQQRIREARELLEGAGDEVDRIFVSAGYGVVREDDRLPLYDVTFADMGAAEIQSRADELEIYENLSTLLTDNEYDLVFFALGDDYYRSAKVDDLLPLVDDETYVVLFNRESAERDFENVLSLDARTPQAKEFGTIVVALKGLYIRNFASHRRAGETVAALDDLAAFCREDASTQTGLDDYSNNS